MGETFIVLTDNQTSLNNLNRFLKDNKAPFSVNEEGGVWTISITKVNVEEVKSAAEEYCTTEIPHFSKGDFIIVFSSDKMGEGDDELGHLLMTNFIKALKDLDVLPQKMVFYNSGVKLGADDSPVASHLKAIEKMGVELFLCATCAKYYSIDDKIHVGSMSNMFEITQLMASSGNIIKP